MRVTGLLCHRDDGERLPGLGPCLGRGYGGTVPAGGDGCRLGDGDGRCRCVAADIEKSNGLRTRQRPGSRYHHMRLSSPRPTRNGGPPSSCFPAFQALGMTDVVPNSEFTEYDADEPYIR